MSRTKPFCISKKSVMAAWVRVRSNKGSAGVDKQSLEDFESNLKDNLYKIWNRMSSGTYFPPPVKGVEIPKSDGKVRLLGIPTVADRVAQTVVLRSPRATGGTKVPPRLLWLSSQQVGSGCCGSSEEKVLAK